MSSSTSSSSSSSGEILVVPKIAQGHLFPCIEICKLLLSRNYSITLLVDSDITSSIPSSLLHSPLFHFQLTKDIHGWYLQRDPGDSTRPICAIIDHIINKNTHHIFSEFAIPTVVFITSGACWAAVQHAIWVVRPGDMRPGDVRTLPGLPEDMVLKYSDLKQRRHWMKMGPPHKQKEGPRGEGPRGDGRGGPRGPPFPGEPAPWVEEVESAAAILINTCDDLERPFLDYVANLTRKPVWGVGPLLPDQYWESADSLLLRVQDQEIRPNKESNYTEDQVIEWLDQQPRGSVVYVSFGSEVGPTMEEYPELTKALEELTGSNSFIWVIQKKSDYFPNGLDGKVGKKGLIIHGWAPQLLILSHPSTGGFVSHCGWNSTVEAIVRGVPLLAWPIRGDQYYNAMLVVNHLKVGAMVSEKYPAEMVNKDDILGGMQRVLKDNEIRRQSEILGAKFEQGFPASSLASLDAFSDFIKHKAAA
ncbi:hypothetical protein ACB094_10G005500 [Castanea mollissima]